MTIERPIPAVSLTTARSGASTKPNELGMRVMRTHPVKAAVPLRRAQAA